MNEPAQSAPVGPSVRVRLAELARETALATPGVADLDSGPTGLFFTAGGGTRVAGVTCAAAPHGGFDLALRLVCHFVPLHPVADDVRARIETAAALGGLEAETVTIEVTDVLDSAQT